MGKLSLWKIKRFLGGKPDYMESPEQRREGRIGAIIGIVGFILILLWLFFVEAKRWK